MYVATLTCNREEFIEIHLCCYVSLKDSNYIAVVAFSYLIIHVVWHIFTCRHKLITCRKEGRATSNFAPETSKF